MFESLRRVRYALGAFVLGTFAVGLIAATPPPALPAAPAPLAAPSATPSPLQLGALPALVVFPFQVNAALQPAAGGDYAKRIAAAIAQIGGVDVTLDPATTEPARFPLAAKVANADYYLSGFVAPVGRTVTVIQQLVSMRSGTIVWSNSAEVLTEADALAQAQIIRTAIVNYATRGYYALGLATPKPAATTPKPKRGGSFGSAGSGGTSSSGGTIGGAVRATPLPLPPEAYGYTLRTPGPVYASTEHPSRYAILGFTGKQPPSVRDFTANAMIEALGKRGQTAALADPDTSEHPLLRGKEICAQTGASMLVWGTVATVSNDASKGESLWTTAVLNVFSYDCSGAGFTGMKKAVIGSAGPWKAAIQHAAAQAVSDYLLPPTTSSKNS